MTATADFAWNYDLQPNTDLQADRFNLAMTQLESYVNSLKARMDLVDGAVIPSQYATTATLNAHVAATSPHAAVARLGSTVALAGVSTAPSTALTVQTLSGTIGGGGYLDFTFVSAFLNALNVALPVHVSATPSALSISSPALGSCRVYGPVSAAVRLVVMGW